MKLWIRLDASVRSDPNVAELAERLKIPFAEAVGLCSLVWCAIAEHRPSGDITGLSISTLEKWAGYEPRKGKPAGAFAAAFLELFTSDGEASGWHHRQGALIERAEKERARKARGKSAPIPRKGASTERNGTERLTTQSVSARVRLEKRLTDERQCQAVGRFLDSLPAGQNAERWAATIGGWLDGLPVQGSQTAQAEDVALGLSDYVVSDKPSYAPAHVRAFIARAIGSRNKPAPGGRSPARAEWLYDIFTKHGFCQPYPMAEYEKKVAELAASGVIADASWFLRDMKLIEPWTTLRGAREFDRAKNVQRISALIAKAAA